ncbi:MAG: hypothetical protein DI586_05960 [Micavibrio aeruginosavorus]|uniref:GAF domain-containing protein n=1 Tax=Micavibrio aeruginosavorus TaxID=349221 RepID=A0A2W5FL44_9BACT|nr:MAG: hypothetical protein DI586_05960 [Micavibrio aeruginosavorus]
MDLYENMPRIDAHKQGMKYLVDVAQDLTGCRDLGMVMDIVRRAARYMTGADGATFVLRDDDKCYYADECSISPLWKGQRFPMSACISGWVMNNSRSVVIPDVYTDSRIPLDVYKRTFVRSMAMVPIRKYKALGAIGNYWSYTRYTSAEELRLLEDLASITAAAIENALLFSKLQEHIKALEGSNSELKRISSLTSP